jgi:hypothetical protein
MHSQVMRQCALHVMCTCGAFRAARWRWTRSARCARACNSETWQELENSQARKDARCRCDGGAGAKYAEPAARACIAERTISILLRMRVAAERVYSLELCTELMR